MVNKNLTRAGLINKLSDKFNIDPNVSKTAMLIIIKAMVKSLAQNHRIEIRKFGSFEIHTRSARPVRNPKTGEKFHISEQHVTHFKAGAPLRNRTNINSK